MGAAPVHRCRKRHPYLEGPYPRAIAHRGWHVGELAGLENTLAAFHRAVAEGFTYLALDVQASADGVPVVYHDATLGQTREGSEPIAVLSAAQIAQSRVGATEPVPLLEQVLTELPPTVRFLIELKSDDVVRPVLALLERHDVWHRVCLGSAVESRLQRARAAVGRQLITAIARHSAWGLRGLAWLDSVVGSVKPASRVLRAVPIRGDVAQLPLRFRGLWVVDEALVRSAHARGLEVHVQTVDDPAEMTTLLDIGVDGILSDRPDLLREVLIRRGAWDG